MIALFCMKTQHIFFGTNVSFLMTAKGELRAVFTYVRVVTILPLVFVTKKVSYLTRTTFLTYQF